MNDASIPPKREGVCAACGRTFPGPKRGPIAAFCPPCKRERRNFRSVARPNWRSENGRASMAARPTEQRSAAGRAGAAARWAGHESAPKRVRLPDIKCPYCPDMMRPRRKQCGKPKCKTAFNRDRGREYLSEWTREHGKSYAQAKYPEKRRAASRAWKLEHPEERREQRSACGLRRRAIKLGVTGTHTTAFKQAQYKRQHGKCFYRKVNPECDVSLKDGYHIEHVIPLAGDRTSSNGPENIVLSCPKCNGSKGAKDPMDWAGIMF